MQIIRVRFDGFGSFIGAEFDFRPGDVNLIVGRNEAGKSTLMRSMLAILFGLKSPDRFRPWGNPDTFAGAIEFSARGSHCKVERDFARGRVILSRIHKDQEVILYEGNDAPGNALPRPYVEALASVLPITSAELFHKTTFVAQEQLDTDIKEELKEIITGTAGRSYATEMERMRREYFSLSSHDPWSPGQSKKGEKLLEKLKAGLKSLQYRRSRIERELEEGTMLRALVERLEEEETGLLDEADQTRTTWETARTLAQLFSEQREIQKRIASLEVEEKRVRSFMSKRAALEATLKGSFADVSGAPEEMEKDWEDLKECARNWRRVEKIVQAKKSREIELENKLDLAKKAIESRFADFAGKGEGIPQRVRALAALRSQYAQKQARLGALQSKTSGLEERLAKEFPEFAGITSPLVAQVQELATLEEDLANTEKMLKERRSTRIESEQELSRTRAELAELPEGVGALPADFPLRLATFLDKNNALKALAESVAEQEAKLARIPGKGPVFWAMICGPVAALIGAISGYFAGGPVGAAGLGFGGAASAVAVASAAGYKTSASRGMAKATLSGLRAQSEKLQAEIDEHRPGLLGFEQEQARLDFERYQSLKSAQERLERELAPTADVALLEQELAGRSAQIQAIKARIGPVAQAAPAATLLARAVEHGEILRELAIKRGQLDALLDPIQDDKTGRTASSVERLEEAIDVEVQALGPLATRNPDTVASEYDERKKQLAELAKLQNLLEDIKGQRYVELEAIKQEIETLRNRLGGLIKGKTTEEIDARFLQYSGIKHSLEQMRTMMKANRSLEEIESNLSQAREDLNLRVEECRRLMEDHPQLKSMGDSAQAAEDAIARLEEKLDGFEKTIEDKQLRIHEAREQLAKASGEGGDNLETLIREMGHVENLVETLERRCVALKIAVDILRDSVAEYQNAYLERLSRRSGEIFKDVTSGKYTEVRLGEGLEPTLVHAGTGVELAPGVLSCGARDQLYFCIRIALAEELAGDLRLPFILDDPFANFDEERLLKIIEFLKSLRPHHQTLLFTHDTRYLSWAETTVNLDGLTRSAAN